MNLTTVEIEYLIGSLTIVNLAILGAYYTYRYYYWRRMNYIPIIDF